METSHCVHFVFKERSLSIHKKTKHGQIVINNIPFYTKLSAVVNDIKKFRVIVLHVPACTVNECDLFMGDFILVLPEHKIAILDSLINT